MRTDRRGFLRFLASALAFLGADPARAQEMALEIHRGTRNTWFGALGATRALRRPPEPFKPYPSAERTKLPASSVEPGLPLLQAVRTYAPTRGFRPESLSLVELGRTLYLTNGMTGREPGRGRRHDHRAAPSAGALYACELYVVAERVRGLPEGVYYYAVQSHELVRLRPGAFLEEVERAVERPRAVENAAAVVLLTNVFLRYSHRYANRGYRYALIDTGHVGENLRLAAFSAGLGETAPLRFRDDLLAALLRVDAREEAVCAVHAIGRAADPAAERPERVRRYVERHRSAAWAPDPSAALTERYHEATSLVPTDRPTKRTAPPKPSVHSPVPGVALPRREAPPPAPLEQAIRRRCSAGRFGPRPLSLAELGFFLEVAQGQPALQRAAGVDLYLAAHRVTDLEPGLYRYEPTAHRLAPIRRGELSRPLIRACLGQGQAGTAAVACLMVARLQEAAARGGDRSYRDLLIESGAIAERLYLAAAAAGLRARNLAAFRDDELNELLGWDGRREAAIHLTVIGHRAR